jgi:hypothetical protein
MSDNPTSDNSTSDNSTSDFAYYPDNEDGTEADEFLVGGLEGISIGPGGLSEPDVMLWRSGDGMGTCSECGEQFPYPTSGLDSDTLDIFWKHYREEHC